MMKGGERSETFGESGGKGTGGEGGLKWKEEAWYGGMIEGGE